MVVKMLSENTILLIMESLDKKEFLTKKFLYELEEVILFYDNLNLYFSGFDIVNRINSYTVAFYNTKTKKIIFCKDHILSEYEDFLKLSPVEDNIIRRNLFFLHIILHELVHVYQKFLVHMNTTYDDLINDSLMTIEGMFSPYKLSNILPTSINTYLINDFYHKKHAIFPNELHANGVALEIENKIIKKCNYSKEYLDYTTFLISHLLGQYKIKRNEIISPIRRFYKSINLLDSLNYLDYSLFTDREKFLFGLTENINVINKEASELLFLSKSIDLSDAIKECSSPIKLFLKK